MSVSSTLIRKDSNNRTGLLTYHTRPTKEEPLLRTEPINFTNCSVLLLISLQPFKGKFRTSEISNVLPEAQLPV